AVLIRGQRFFVPCWVSAVFHWFLCVFIFSLDEAENSSIVIATVEFSNEK
ncbi:MAG: hypothetical protein ACI9FU_000788, partial [Granulosicoccus sp.]